MATKPATPAKALKREPELPPEWIEEYDRRMRKKRRQEVRERFRKKKADIMEKVRKEEEEKRGHEAWLQRKEQHRLNGKPNRKSGHNSEEKTITYQPKHRRLQSAYRSYRVVDFTGVQQRQSTPTQENKNASTPSQP